MLSVPVHLPSCKLPDVRFFFPVVLFFVVYPSNCHVIVILCDVGEGLHWRDTRAAAPAAASRLLSYCQNPGVPPPSRLAEALTHVVSGDRDPQR